MRGLLPPGELPGLALGGDRRGDDHGHVVHLPNRARAERRHRLAQRAGEVLRPVRRLGRAEQDLLEGQPLADADPRSARQGRRRCRHAPVEAPARCLEGRGEWRAEHHRIGP